MTDYIIIQQHMNDIALFIDQVNEKLDAGWVAQGGVTVTHDDIFVQALVKVTP